MAFTQIKHVTTLTAKSAFMKIVLKVLLTAKCVRKCVIESESPTYVVLSNGTGGETGRQGYM